MASNWNGGKESLKLIYGITLFESGSQILGLVHI